MYTRYSLSYFKRHPFSSGKLFSVLMAILLLMGFATSSFANNTWTFVGDLNTERAYHSATTFNSTQVLVAGGNMDSAALDSAEIFDLSTSLWSFTSSMNEARQKHAAVLLDDGKVLVVGGSAAALELASTEIYDPTTASWSAAASMSAPRINALITKLQDGRILVSGGSRAGVGLTSAEIYDPASNSWSSTGAMQSDTVHTNAAVLLNDGRVFIKGHAGYINGPFVDISPDDPYYPEESPTKLPQIFDPTSNSWAAASPMNTPKLGGTAIVLNDGNVLVVGGEVFQEMYWGYPYFHCYVPAEIYDPNTNTWTQTGTQASGSLNPSKVSLLPDGKVLAFGPSIYVNLYSACGSDNGQTDIFDPATGTWNVTDSAETRHHLGGAYATLAGGKVLTIGGGDLKNIVEIYTPSGPSPEPPPRSEILHVGDIDGEAIEHNNYPQFTWSAIATFTILDEEGQAVEGANVSSVRSSLQTTPDVCTTDILGQCSAETVSPFYSDRSFTVVDISKPLMSYDATANTDPDGDSDGTTIVIPRGDGPPPPTMHVSDLDSSSKKKSKKRWQATVSIKMVNWNNDPEYYVEVFGTWSGGASGIVSCLTNTDGICQVTSNTISNSNTTATFTVTNAVDDNFEYDPTLNTDADGDSNGTSITVSKP